MFQLPRRALVPLLALFLLALFGLACYGHHRYGPTEVVACSDLSGSWEEVADSSCLGTRRSSLQLKQTGCTVFGSSAGLQADVTLALDDHDRATAQLNFFGCTGTVTGTATVSGREVDGEFEGMTSGPQANCCGHVKGTFRWLR